MLARHSITLRAEQITLRITHSFHFPTGMAHFSCCQPFRLEQPLRMALMPYQRDFVAVRSNHPLERIAARRKIHISDD